MPQYDWLCDGCTCRVTKKMSIKQYNPREKVYCPNCGEEVKRTIEQVGISFGKGFFRDGYQSAKDVKTPTDGE